MRYLVSQLNVTHRFAGTVHHQSRTYVGSVNRGNSCAGLKPTSQFPSTWRAQQNPCSQVWVNATTRGSREGPSATIKYTLVHVPEMEKMICDRIPIRSLVQRKLAAF
ncbi:hypothetical protein LIA77_02510 [Sarocladium implicatum]|nr:hypothetical protein LIA77_02510 [Sarocladium implicatum]